MLEITTDVANMVDLFSSPDLNVNFWRVHGASFRESQVATCMIRAVYEQFFLLVEMFWAPGFALNR